MDSKNQSRVESIINIGNRREVFWDEYLIDTDKTTAQLKLHKLRPREVVLEHNEPWEGDGCDYHCIVKDEGLYRMYYLGWETMNPEVTKHVPRPIVVCYAESKDGITWVKPKLGLCEFNSSKENNIIIDNNTAKIDNFFVFKDDNPNCREDELYKGIGLDGNDCYLWCFTSKDGTNFKKSHPITNKGKFDSLNTALWDKNTNQYICYIRDFHKVPGNDLNAGIRDIRWIVSKDFKNWSNPVLLDFGNMDDYPLYTNVIQKYYRADHMFVGFPSRYIEKKEWTSTFEQLAGAERRKKRMRVHPRYGLAVTDCLFMSSRDGKNWNRWEEAFIRPGIEREYNWVYGDCYPAVGMIETKSDLPHAPNEISMYVFENHWGMIPTKLRRYIMRIDGFVSYNAPYNPAQVTTKPFIFKGSNLSINFSTSAVGYIKIKLISIEDNKEFNSGEIFGDSLDRKVIFEEGNLTSVSGNPVRMIITMKDADFYSFKFD